MDGKRVKVMYERLDNKLKNTSALQWFSGHEAEESWIAEAEEELGFRLPPSYRWWLSHYGNARLDGGEILSLAPPEHRGFADSDLLYMHRVNRADEEWNTRYPHRLDLFVPDSDELYFFDTSLRDERGEFPIMRCDLMDGSIETYALSFEEFLERLIDEHS